MRTKRGGGQIQIKVNDCLQSEILTSVCGTQIYLQKFKWHISCLTSDILMLQAQDLGAIYLQGRCHGGCYTPKDLACRQICSRLSVSLQYSSIASQGSVTCTPVGT